MLYIHNIKQYVKSLGEYIENRDYSHPYIVAGWSGIGKSAIAYKGKKQFPTLQEIDFNLSREDPNAVKAIMKVWSTPSDHARIICITTGIDMSHLRDIDFNVCEVHYLEFDKDLWLDWAQQVDENGICNVQKTIVDFLKQNPEQMHSNIQILAEAEAEVRADVDAILNYDGCNGAEVLHLLDTLFRHQQMVYLRKDKIENQWEAVLSHLSEIKPKFSDKELEPVLGAVMQIAECNSKLYV